MLNEKNENGVNIWINENDFFEIVRDTCQEWVEEVKLMDTFYNKKREMHSRMYRLTYSPIDPSLKDPSDFNKLCNDIQNNLREKVKSCKDLNIDLR